jgi:hypothetical protein
MKTIAMKLVSGEELIGRSVSETATLTTISHARTMGLQQDQQGRYGVGMMDYILANKDCEISISKDKIITMYEPAVEVEKAYLSQTSGIQLS